MKKTFATLQNEQGFALIVAIMMLFAATVMGLMVMNSSEIEILLSGAQQRYEQNMNVADGGTIIETLTNYKYPEAEDAVVSISKSHDANFDPGDDMTADDNATEYIVTAATTAMETLPISNMIQSISHSDDQFDYHYRTLCVKRIKSTGFGTGAAGDNYDTYWRTDVFNGSNIEIGYKTTGK